MTVKISLPRSYRELTTKQYRWLFKTLAGFPDLNSIEFKILAFFRFSGMQVISHDPEGNRLVSVKGAAGICDPETVAIADRALDWILFPPAEPWRPRRLGARSPKQPDFSDVDFAVFLTVENLYQGYLQTQDMQLLRRIARILVPGIHRPFRAWELYAIFYWVASVKDFFAKKFKYFFTPVSEGELAQPKITQAMLESSYNAQIRLLTKGDITKEAEILEMPCWRALVELNALAKEYLDLKSKK